MDRLDKAEGDKVELDKVLLVADDNKVTVGKPAIEGAKVLATSRGTVKGKKIIVLKFKAKTRYTRKTGHRPQFTRLVIDDITVPG